MKARVVQFRRSLKRIHERHFILDVETKSRKEAGNFVGKKVIWKNPAGKEIKEKISSPHKNKGLVRAIFERRLSGQARNKEVEII